MPPSSSGKRAIRTHDPAECLVPNNWITNGWTDGRKAELNEVRTYKLDFSGLAGRAAAGGSRDDDGASGLQGDSKGSTTSTEASM
uniref:Uncharacterized protein n=1 Tax=Anopheles albimanus TaxID=7167 RepID=A0A182FW13_ANOAL